MNDTNYCMGNLRDICYVIMPSAHMVMLADLTFVQEGQKAHVITKTKANEAWLKICYGSITILPINQVFVLNLT